MTGDASRSKALRPPDRCCRNSAGVAEIAGAGSPLLTPMQRCGTQRGTAMMNRLDSSATPNLLELLGAAGPSGFSRAAVSPCGDESDIIELSLCGDEGGDG